MLPPTVLGFYVLVALGIAQPARALRGRHWTGHGLAFTFEALVIALDPLQPAVRRAADRLVVRADRPHAARSVGHARRQSDCARSARSSLPLSIDGIIAGGVLTFAHTLGEFGVVLMVGGNLPGITRTVSISIYDDVQALNFSSAHQTALLLLLFSFATLAVGLRR